MVSSSELIIRWLAVQVRPGPPNGTVAPMVEQEYRKLQGDGSSPFCTLEKYMPR